MSEASGSSASDSEFQAPPVETLWRTTWTHRGEILSWDIACAGLLTAAAVVFIDSETLRLRLNGLLIAEFGLVGALLGLVIAGLAVVIGFLGHDYAVTLMRSEKGPSGDFWPFWYAAALAALAILAAGAGLLVSTQWPCLRTAVFGVTTFLSSYTVFATVNLVAFVKAQGETRALLLARKWEVRQREKDGGM